MGKSTLIVQGYEPEEIKKIINSNDAFMVGIRLYIVYKVSQEFSSRKLAELYGISFKQITNWVHRFEREGTNGLNDKKGRGRKSLLDEKQLQRLESLILEEYPSTYGYTSKKWTGPIITNWVKAEFGIEYKEAQVYNLLDKIGIAFVKGKGLIKV